MRVGVEEGDADSIVDKVGVVELVLERIDVIVVVLCGVRLRNCASVGCLTVDEKDRRSPG